MIPARFMSLLAILVSGCAAAADRSPPAGVEPPRIIQTVDARFPDGLTRRGIFDGEVRIVMLILAEGRLADWLLISYSHPLIAREATEVLQLWKFEPARRNGEPIDARIDVRFSFEATGMVVSMDFSSMAERLHPRRQELVQRVSPPAELDTPLKVVRAVRPLWPSDFASEQPASVVLDFFVDEQGRPRMPVVRETDHEALVLPAMEALSHWRFEVPTRRGVPVIVRARQMFRFHQRGGGDGLQPVDDPVERGAGSGAL